MSDAEKALIALARAQAKVSEINKLIGAALAASAEAIPDGENTGGAKNKWLDMAYEREHVPFEGSYFVNHDGDIEGFLAERCQHALRAHQLIQERKPLRQALGIAKRRVTALANRLAKEASCNE